VVERLDHEQLAPLEPLVLGARHHRADHDQPAPAEGDELGLGKVEQSRHPGDDGDDVEGFDIGEQHLNCQR
jgi:hypothetical protein